MAKGIAGEMVCDCGDSGCRVCNPPCCKCAERDQSRQTVEAVVLLNDGLRRKQFTEIKNEFGDCDWMVAVMKTYTVDSVLWMMAELERLYKQYES